MLGPLPLAIALLAVALVLVVAASLRRGAPEGPPPPVDPAQEPDIRAVRDRDGEVAAVVRRLRDARPELSLLDATRMVRSL